MGLHKIVIFYSHHAEKDCEEGRKMSKKTKRKKQKTNSPHIGRWLKKKRDDYHLPKACWDWLEKTE